MRRSLFSALSSESHQAAKWREGDRERERERDRQRGGKDERKTGKRREESIPSLESLLVRQPAAAAALSLVL